ncbi:exopolysaccharide biosynthesis protein [Caulobacter ginsengisoli]|uniref:Exopolysaccharide biosynthesis protein n=1 Tax=Caulobacter ginsengisoli TaxID=400775 RepID=A0ABU0IW61_9CAUL|nr:phosphodiester glycosidase family protein [Caulobacter ginsengisoli]MDQ0465388.1 exopolysaccharide biosynthesis protein [Caulobacter ginsengisoli]
MRRLVLMAVLLAAVPGLALAQAGACTIPGFQQTTPLLKFQGVAFSTVTDPNNDFFGEVLTIDLTAPGVGFTASTGGGSQDTRSATTGQFLVASNTAVAINANLFWPCCQDLGNGGTSADTVLLGMVVAKGQQVSGQNIDPFEAGTALVTFGAGNQVAIQTPAVLTPLNGVVTAVAGTGIIVQQGQNNGGAQNPRYADPFGSAARTMLGLSQDGDTLYLVTIDGKAGDSGGLTVPQAASVMICLNAWTAVNLDGGGSSSMVQSDGQGGYNVLNNPSDGSLRFVGASLGVFAQPLPAARRP